MGRLFSKAAVEGAMGRTWAPGFEKNEAGCQLVRGHLTVRGPLAGVTMVLESRTVREEEKQEKGNGKGGEKHRARS